MTTFDDLHQIIVQGENARVEFKAEFSEEVFRGLGTDIAAMANSQGGTIIFGVTDEKDPKGLILKGDERERISQTAYNCTPAIGVDFEEVRLGSRAFILVKVPRSSIVHNDPHRKFPARIGNTTGYLDALGLVALLSERGLTEAEGLQYSPPPERKREPLATSEADMMVKALNDEDQSIRLEALQDLSSLQYRYILIEHRPLRDCIEKILLKGDPNEIRFVLQMLRSVVLWGTSREKETAGSWSEIVLRLGKVAPDHDIARNAYDVLQFSRDPRAVDLVVYWVKEMSDSMYSAVAPGTLLRDTGAYGLKSQLHAAMYNILFSNPHENIRKRVNGLLDALRQAL